MHDTVVAAANAVAQAQALLIAAGAGMGVDSGMPDFRGDQGFWRAYPAFAHLGLRFVDLANPCWFTDDPELAWGFYGHRLNLYRRTTPHVGFTLLHNWATQMPDGAFVLTSNVDGQFQRAGFTAERIFECHGSIHHLQCNHNCDDIWPADAIQVYVDEESCRARPPLPRCPSCNTIARPNILMFGDGAWQQQRSDEQSRAFQHWLARIQGQRLVIIELGAGLAVPTIRWHCERIAATYNAIHIRINPREAQGPRGCLSLASGARDALGAIEAQLQKIRA